MKRFVQLAGGVAFHGAEEGPIEVLSVAGGLQIGMDEMMRMHAHDELTPAPDSRWQCAQL